MPAPCRRLRQICANWPNGPRSILRSPKSCASPTESLSRTPPSTNHLLDHLFETFGEDKLIFGSDWPNGSAVNNLPAIVGIVQEYFHTKGIAAREKYFWKNSVAAYKWKPRDAGQQRFA